MGRRATAIDYALFLLRLAGLFLAIRHGWGKIYGLATGSEGLVNFVSDLGFPLPLLFAWAAALSEFVGGLAVALGLFTRTSAFFAAFTMATAAFVRHQALVQFGAWIGLVAVDAETLQSYGSPEMSMLFLLIMAALIILGGGRFSVDHRLATRRR
jgi:putative oxidoreductase